ncbi:MAG: RCC1 domain-containing protein [Polyangiales bacterium]
MRSDGTLRCHGSGLDVPDLSSLRVSQIAIGKDHACALLIDGAVACWGENETGQLGDGTDQRRTTPVRVTGISDAVDIVVGTWHSGARLRDGTVMFWGSNEYGQLGERLPTPADLSTYAIRHPKRIDGFRGAKTIALGGAHSCALTQDGFVECFGNNSNGSLGDGTHEQRMTPVRVKGLSGISGIAAGGNHTCAWRDDGSAWCWGSNTAGEIGDGTTTLRSLPVALKGLKVRELATGWKNTCALLQDRSLWCWGQDDGFLGGSDRARSAAVRITALGDVDHVASGPGADDYVCARKVDASLWCFGPGYHGATTPAVPGPMIW